MSVATRLFVTVVVILLVGLGIAVAAVVSLRQADRAVSEVETIVPRVDRNTARVARTDEAARVRARRNQRRIARVAEKADRSIVVLRRIVPPRLARALPRVTDGAVREAMRAGVAGTAGATGATGAAGGVGAIGATGAGATSQQVEDVARPILAGLIGPAVDAAILARCGESCEGSPGRDGERGRDAPPVTPEQRAADVDAYCASRNACKGDTGSAGPKGDPGPPPQPFTIEFMDGTGKTHRCTIDPLLGPVAPQPCA